MYNAADFLGGAAWLVLRTSYLLTFIGLSSMMLNRLILVLAALLVAAVVHSQTREELIAERLKPVGEVTMAAAAPEGPMDPETIYNTYCFACHNGAIETSPALGDVAAWSERIAKGTDVLYESGINGIAGTLMPAMGTCMSCSDDDIKATVDYMVAQSQ